MKNLVLLFLISNALCSDASEDSLTNNRFGIGFKTNIFNSYAPYLNYPYKKMDFGINFYLDYSQSRILYGPDSLEGQVIQDFSYTNKRLKYRGVGIYNRYFPFSKFNLGLSSTLNYKRSGIYFNDKKIQYIHTFELQLALVYNFFRQKKFNLILELGAMGAHRHSKNNYFLDPPYGNHPFSDLYETWNFQRLYGFIGFQYNFQTK